MSVGFPVRAVPASRDLSRKGEALLLATQCHQLSSIEFSASDRADTG